MLRPWNVEQANDAAGKGNLSWFTKEEPGCETGSTKSAAGTS